MSIARARIEGEMRGLKTSLLDLTKNVIRLRRQLRDIEIQAETNPQAGWPRLEGQSDFDPLEPIVSRASGTHAFFMAESVNDVATVQQNLLKNLDDANAALRAGRLNRGLARSSWAYACCPSRVRPSGSIASFARPPRELGKRANLDIRGGQVEIDRSVLDKMLAP